MKKQFLTFAMLASMVANAAVKVTPLGVDYSTQKVTFSVSWTGSPADNRVWVWIDFCPVTGTSPGAFAKAEISGATATAGNIDATTLNGRGFYVTTNPSTVTATLNNAPTGKFNWCVYGSDAPPNVLANTNGSYTLAGTPPFTLIASNGTTTQTVNEKTIAIAAVTMMPATITDATGYPGLWCPYTGSDLYMDATHRCLQRQSGAKNWEAHIRDSRDNQIYRITQFSDGRWWFADDFNIDLNVVGICGDIRYYSIKNYPACPTDWSIPAMSEVKTRWASGYTDDPYGGPITIGYTLQGSTCVATTVGRCDILVTNCGNGGAIDISCDGSYVACNNYADSRARMRCWRKL